MSSTGDAMDQRPDHEQTHPGPESVKSLGKRRRMGDAGEMWLSLSRLVRRPSLLVLGQTIDRKEPV